MATTCLACGDPRSRHIDDQHCERRFTPFGKPDLDQRCPCPRYVAARYDDMEAKGNG